MPAAKIVNRELIINKSFELVRSEGIEKLSARNIAKKIGCSTQPVYSSFSSMDELVKDVFQRCKDYVVTNYLLHDGQEFIKMGIGYVEIARNERHLFRLLFLSDEDIGRSAVHIWQEYQERFLKSMRFDQDLINLNDEELVKILHHMRIYSHGLATLVYSNPQSVSQTEVYQLFLELGQRVIEWELSQKAGRLVHLNHEHHKG